MRGDNERAGRLVLVSGSREPLTREEQNRVTCVLYEVFESHLPVVLMHGGATGVDAHAACVARAAGHVVIAMPAQWREHGKSAGPRRNNAMINAAAAMVECGWELVVVAFPRASSRGTRDMIKRARGRGAPRCEVIVHELDESGYGVETAGAVSVEHETHLVGNPDTSGPPLVRVPVGCDRPGCSRKGFGPCRSRNCQCRCHR